MPRLTILGDPHVTNLNVPAELVARRMDYLKNLPHIADDEDGTLICLGDLHDSKASLSPKQHEMLSEVLYTWAHAYNRVYILQGNHDVANLKDTTSHVAQIIDDIDLPQLVYVHDVHMEPILDIDRPSHCIQGLFIPWHPDQESKLRKAALYAQSCLDIYEDRPCTIYTFGHFGIKDFAYDNGRVATDAISCDNLFDILKKSTHPRVYMGHFHNVQNAWRGNVDIQFVGSAYDTLYRPVDARRCGLITVNEEENPTYHRPPKGTDMLKFEEGQAEEALKLFLESQVCMKVTARDSELLREAVASDSANLLTPLRPPAPELKREARIPMTAHVDYKFADGVMEAVDQYMEFDTECDLDHDKVKAVLAATVQNMDKQHLASKHRVDMLDVRLENFMPHVDTQLEFTPGLHLIDGRNSNGYSSSVGAGKSSIIEAVRWAMHGKLLRDGVPAAGVVRRGDAEAPGCRVTLRFAVSGRVSTLMRYRDDPILGNVGVRVECGDDVYDGSAAEDYLTVTTGLTDPIFRSAVCFGRATKQMLTAVGSAQRKAILAELTGASTMFELVHARLKDKRQTHMAALSGISSSIMHYQSMLDINAGIVEETKRKHDEWEANRESEVVRLRGEVETHNAKLVAERARLAKLRRVANRADASAERAHRRVMRLNAERVECLRKFEELRYVKHAPCENCGYVKDKIDVHAEERKVYNQRVAKIDELLDTTEGVRAQRLRLSSKLRETNDTQVHTLRELEVTVGTLEAKLSMYGSTENPHAYNHAEGQVAEANKQIEGLTLARTEAEELGRVLDYLCNITGPNGLPVFIIEQALGEINTEANRILSSITDGSLQLALTARTGGGRQRQQHVDLNVINARGGDSFAASSDGEQHLEAFALTLAAVKYANRCSLLFIDELFDNVDTVVASKMLVAVEEFARDNDLCVLATTHKEELKPSFPNIITVCNDGNGAYIDNA